MSHCFIELPIKTTIEFTENKDLGIVITNKVLTCKPIKYQIIDKMGFSTAITLAYLVDKQ
jgi:hypothetical protein